MITTTPLSTAAPVRTGRSVSLANVTVRYGSRAALDNVSIDLAAGEVFTLIGPSGSGKSTLLRVIAGLERPATGRIAIDRIEVAGPVTFVEPEDRRVGMVFQDYALFPHLTVAANVGYVLTGVPVDDEELAVLLEPWAGHRHRVQRLVELGGLGRPRRGPRMAPRTHLPRR